MKQKLISIILVVIISISMLPLCAGASGIPSSWEAPTSLSASEQEYLTALLFSVNSEILKFTEADTTEHEKLGINSVNTYSQIDWKLNNGSWHYTPDWDTLNMVDGDNYVIYSAEGIQNSITQRIFILDLRNHYGEQTDLQRELGNAIIKGSNDEGNRLDLKNNTFYFRVRMITTYYVWDEARGEGTDKYILSPWSEVLAYGKNSVSLPKPTKLEAPVISNVKAGKNSDGSPNFTITVKTPQQIRDADSYLQSKDGCRVEADYEMNINNGGWITAPGGWLGDETCSIDVPASYSDSHSVKIDEAYIQIRMRYEYIGGATVPAMQSPWSNIVSVNTPGWSIASQWATAELQKAADAGLIPNILKDADMTKPITREEFCELAVLLYEKVTDRTTEAASPNPFTDTTNPQILKAYKLGVTQGTSANTFSPKVLINREQCAVMLFRAIKAIKPDEDYSIAGVKDFPDQKHISSWAVEATKYMSKIGIIKGDSNGNFMPKATTTAQQAAGYGMATREAAVLMTVRTFDKMQ